MLASLKSMEASRATLAYVVFGCILAIMCSLVLIQAEADMAASTINCAAFRMTRIYLLAVFTTMMYD